MPQRREVGTGEELKQSLAEVQSDGGEIRNEDKETDR